jgi:hypothetical protein
MNRLVHPRPKHYTGVLIRLNRPLDLNSRDHHAAPDFSLKVTPPVSEEHEQDVLLVAPIVVEAPQKEQLFSPEALS